MPADAQRRPHPRRARRPRRASVYVLVLATAAIATAAGLGGILIQRTRLRAASTNADIDAARLAAASGLEYALGRIDADPNWRTTIGAGAWLDAASLGNATLSVSVIDPEGDAIADDPLAPIVVQTLGRSGPARQAFDATIEFDAIPVTALQCAAYSGYFTYTELTTLAADAPVHSAGDMDALLATVNAPAEAVGTVAGLTYFRGTSSGATPRTAPAASVVATWAALGTTIPYSTFTSGTLRQRVIARGIAVGAVTNTSSDVFVVNCAGSALTIRDARIYGTLVVLNCSGVTITSSVRIDPVTPGYPSLIVQGPIRMQVATAALSESSNGVNFNPIAAPYLGAGDNDMTDTYPSGISGIVFATDDITIENSLSVTGTLITLDQLVVRKPLTITHDPNVLTAAAPGFYTVVPRLADAGVERVSR